MIGLLLKVGLGTTAGRAVLVGLGLLGAFNGGKAMQWWNTPAPVHKECKCPEQAKEVRRELDLVTDIIGKILKGL